MSSSYGKNIRMSIFGESHGKAIGVTIDGLPAGIELNINQINQELSLRKSSNVFNTSRIEKDEFEIISGYLNGFTTGTPLTFLIINNDKSSKDYSNIKDKVRPSHADYTAHIKYNGFQDYRGGGHFSGRLTAPMVIAGSIARELLKTRGIDIETIFSQVGEFKREIKELDNEMLEYLTKINQLNDSVGGCVKTIIRNIEPGIGEPIFDNLESKIAGGLFAIPGVKAVSFGIGTQFAESLGSHVNDEFTIKNEKIITRTNNNGGVNGGITNGMPVVVNTTFKPSSSIGKTQNTVDIKNRCNTTLEIKGRHDSFYINRARVVVESIIAFTLLDLIIESEGKKWIN